MEILKSPLNWTGSKHLLIEELKKHFPDPTKVNTFYDVFCGGLSVSMNTDYKKTIANDILRPLIDFYVNLQTADEYEIERIKSKAIDKTSKDQYNEVRKKFNETKDPYLFFALISSCTNNMARFNKKMEFNQSFGKRTINDSTIEKLSKYINLLSKKNIEFTSCSYRVLFEILPPQEGDFVYLDPPYGSGKTLSEAGYSNTWTKEDEEGLYRRLDDMNSRGIKFAFSGVSIHKGIENPYMENLSKYKVININHNYEKVARNKNVGNSQEILVINY